ncbi:hypothetical protein COB52_01450 [Candidatus Kaiserbacteria bacterium]|nr:MAG: hypothetical protein COB52_01450 [Candidatus Kaiserbacteria bacterium]
MSKKNSKWLLLTPQEKKAYHAKWSLETWTKLKEAYDALKVNFSDHELCTFYESLLNEQIEGEIDTAGILTRFHKGDQSMTIDQSVDLFVTALWTASREPLA